MRTLVASIVALVLISPIWAQGSAQPKEPEAVVKARAQLAERLRKSNAQHAHVVWINEPELAKLFPGQTFFGVRFRQFPVAIVPPEGFKSSNVFAVSDDAVQRIRDHEDLEEFLKTKLRGEVNLERVKDVTAAWLALAQEYVQDGFYKFEILRKDFTVEKKKQSAREFDRITGRAIVKQGGNGEITVSIDFESGKPKFTHQEKVRPGPRPICQATLLLDPNPLVRHICERDLLIMGLAAREYLMEQRARATPELQREIDRVWQQIQKNGW